MLVSVPIRSAFGPGAQNRVLVPCVLVSLALHALALLLPGLRPGTAAPAATRILTATFTPRDTAPAVRPPVPEVTERAEPEPKRPIVPPKPDATRPKLDAPLPKLDTTRQRPEARPDVPRAGPSTPAPADAAPSASEAPAVPAAAAAGAASEQAAASPGQRQSAAASTGAARVASDADAGTLDQYRLALIGVARRYKRYPSQAMDRGWQGKVEIRLVVGANGMLRSSLVKTSSGYEILDRQALDMVKKAKPLTPIPAALRGREFSVDIPVIFDLQAG